MPIFVGFKTMNWIQRKIYLYNVTFGLYMLDWWERYLFSILHCTILLKDPIFLIYVCNTLCHGYCYFTYYFDICESNYELNK